MKGLLHTYTKSDEPAVDEFLAAMMDYYQIPGVSIALVKDKQLVYHRALGLKNFYTQEPVDEDTLFEAASITKIVFAFAVMRLVERGELDLDKPLHEILPFEEVAHDERYKKITARHCLTHQTGFPNWAWMNPDGKLDIKFDPGTDYGYSGEGFEYLGRVVSKLRGKSLEDVVMEEVQGPMGFATNTYFGGCEALRKVVSHGHYDTRTTGMHLPEGLGVAHSMHTEAKIFANFMTRC